MLFCAAPTMGLAESEIQTHARQRLLFDSGWRFAFGHAYDTGQDFNHATGYFSYLTKTGYGDGPAAARFDDRAWRQLDLPHDWAVEAPFDKKAGYSHGYKAIGRNFPQRSVGWYRKTFTIPKEDQGRRVRIEFDGVFRDAKVFCNGFYLGNEPSGYTPFEFDITDYLNYGGDNVIAVRVDATMEEGWFYEGAGIYRHVWLGKTDPLHVLRYGTFVRSDVDDAKANLAIQTEVVNRSNTIASFSIRQAVLDADGHVVAQGEEAGLSLESLGDAQFTQSLQVEQPRLWSLEDPYRYKLVTTLVRDGQPVDVYETLFGIRTIRFDPDHGFFLNGRHIKLKGTNNHQDHAGVGAALPDALQDYRIRMLKSFGSNTYRASHNPATPELLDACDRLGMLVIDENRLMGSNEFHLRQLETLIKRDRNHPSVILWSIGNEEWYIEGNAYGERIAVTMQGVANKLDPTRPVTTAVTWWGQGISKVTQVLGVNYVKGKTSTDDYHRDFPNTPMVGTEETTTRQTRGIYFDDPAAGHLPPLEEGPTGGNAELGWKHYADRDYLAGLCYWTGFDYRGEPNPYGYPQVASQCGILDLCGFPKDSFYYLDTWWSGEPRLYVTPHWNWAGREDESIPVRVYCNAEEVELLLNGQSLGRQAVERNGHLEWTVPYQPGTLTAHAYREGKRVMAHEAQTTGEPAAVELAVDRQTIKAEGRDIAVITVSTRDNQGRHVPTASTMIHFKLTGPGRIIGVGNGDPASHETERFVDQVTPIRFDNLRSRDLDDSDPATLTAFDADLDGWEWRYWPKGEHEKGTGDRVYRATCTIDRGDVADNTRVLLITDDFGPKASVYLNGELVAADLEAGDERQVLPISRELLRDGRNVIAVVASRWPQNKHGYRSDQGPSLAMQLTTSAGTWKRSLFNGLAQVLVQSTERPGDIILTAEAEGVKPAQITIKTAP